MTRITIVGAGVVGQATGRGFLTHGHSVRFVDVSPAIVTLLREQGLDAFFPEQVDWTASDITMLSVNTPTCNGRIDLTFLMNALETLARGLAGATTFHTVVVRSTVPPTTTERVVRPLLESLSGHRVGEDIGLAMNPEFLRQVSAAHDFLHPRLTVIGAMTATEATILGELYAPFDAPIVHVDPTTAETIKYANNLYNATKISFFNEFYLVCERLGVDADVVSRTVARSAEGMWNPAYGTRGGWPYGGACLPKDTAAFYDFMTSSYGMELPLLAATMQVNALMELRRPAPASMQEVLPPAILATEAHEAAALLAAAPRDERLAFAAGANPVVDIPTAPSLNVPSADDQAAARY